MNVSFDLRLIFSCNYNTATRLPAVLLFLLSSQHIQNKFKEKEVCSFLPQQKIQNIKYRTLFDLARFLVLSHKVFVLNSKKTLSVSMINFFLEIHSVRSTKFVSALRSFLSSLQLNQCLGKLNRITNIKNPTIFNIIRWVAGTIVSLTKHLIFQVLFSFIISCKILCKNPFKLFFYFLITLQK